MRLSVSQVAGEENKTERCKSSFVNPLGLLLDG